MIFYVDTEWKFSIQMCSNLIPGTILNDLTACTFIYCQSILDHGTSDEVEKVRNDPWYKKMKVWVWEKKHDLKKIIDLCCRKIYALQHNIFMTVVVDFHKGIWSWYKNCTGVDRKGVDDSGWG